MGLECVFEASWKLRELRSAPLGTLLEGFCDRLLEKGFSGNLVRKHLAQVGHLNRWLRKEGRLSVEGFSLRTFEDCFSLRAFEDFCEVEGRDIKATRQAMRLFVEYLGRKGTFDPMPASPMYQSLLDSYLAWMREYQHAGEGMLKNRRHKVEWFLKSLGTDATPNGLSRLSAEAIESSFLDYASEVGDSARRAMQGALRTFLRFCLHKGYVREGLEHAVPRLRTYRLARVPRGLSEDQAQAVVESVDRDTDKGRRDYAILTMLHTYGVRAGQLSALQLDDIRWSQDQILFKATKRGKDSLLPLTLQVGEALLEYLQNSRPRCVFREVFLTTGPGSYRPITPDTVSKIVRRHIHRAGIQTPSKGSHAFRHAFASRMVAKGHPLKAVADVLGHRRLSTTFIYTKVDFDALSGVALEWPEEVVS
jgi:site-specific recombinase XerD